MNTNIFIDNQLILKVIIEEICLLLLFLAIGIFIFINFKVFRPFSILKIIGVIIYSLFILKYVTDLNAFYYLYGRKEPLVQVDNKGLTFFLPQDTTVYISWKDVWKIEPMYFSENVNIFLKNDVRVKTYMPFIANYGPGIAASILYTTLTKKQLLELLFKYKEEFDKNNKHKELNEL